MYCWRKAHISWHGDTPMIKQLGDDSGSWNPPPNCGCNHRVDGRISLQPPGVQEFTGVNSPLVNVYIANWKDPPFLMRKLGIAMAISAKYRFTGGYFAHQTKAKNNSVLFSTGWLEILKPSANSPKSEAVTSLRGSPHMSPLSPENRLSRTRLSRANGTKWTMHLANCRNQRVSFELSLLLWFSESKSPSHTFWIPTFLLIFLDSKDSRGRGPSSDRLISHRIIV